ncbi:carboxypeptidase regulatory-like domain-containing protein [Xanthomonas axonopodis pv. vasculorum]|uniref:Oar protein n=1 Tax=Xanthomonas axonopodis pv. vasculorum TaxID=325777 RepID=A0A098PXL4_9XANT|nr:carboxypeptidase regulatory-like domain-containing protein [Xanthomonas axonopodis]KGE51864.1 Oar protein [Xanthomonas axonopodis pv. vasculorum]PPV10554.1 Oar protein [Xanthomonas axonopodis pv. vasculorum]
MTHPRCLRMSKLTLGLVAALAAAPVFAQNTSAGVAGVVTSSGDQPVPNAEVTITHVESGTVSRATTDASGRYNARGLRVGGPYTITITKSGEGTKTEEGVYLNLNQVNTVNADLKGDIAATNLEAVQVMAVAGGSDLFSAYKMGTGTNVSRETIESLPSVNRNIQDYIRLDPRISQVSKADGAISVGGQNTRYNAIRIDGIGAGDPFGLESNNLPTERQPVSMDAIQEINIDVANYDTTISGGTGAVINAVTKSGTNKFGGTVYYAYRDKDMVRKELEGVRFNGFDDEKTYGMTLGGPIVKDKLFFFANYEKMERSAPGVSLADSPYGKGTLTDADIARAQQIATGYGFNAGSLAQPSNSTEVEEYALKIDWNINENHRAAVRYNKLEQNVVRFPQISNSAVSLSTFWYQQPKTYESWMGEMFSDWSDNFSTEFKLSRKEYSAIREPYSTLPQIQIRGFGGTTVNDSLYFGTEQNSHVNAVESKELSAFGAANWYVGDHTIKFGFDYSDNDLLNYYGRNLNGVYLFNNLNDFAAGRVNQYIVRAPRPGGSYDDIPAEYTLKNTGLFLQDSWAVNSNLTVQGGVRVDMPDFSDQRLYNPRIMSLYGYDNTQLPDDKLVQPRFGFNYTFDSDRPTQLRGGLGLFGGAAPNVWLAGVYQNTGLNYTEYTVNNPVGIFTPNTNPPYIPSSGAGARQNVDIAAPDLKLPSVWKTNLAFDHELPWYGIVASAEVVYTKVNNAIYLERLDLYNQAGVGATRIGQDGRELYWNAAGYLPSTGNNTSVQNGQTTSLGSVNGKANRPADMGDVMLMRNTDKGDGKQFTFGLNKPLINNWGWSLAYTYTAATEVSPLTSSQNTSNWGGTLIGTANENVAYDSRYALKDRITGSLNWKKAFFGKYNTSVGLFYEGRSGRPFSYIYYNDMNGDAAATSGNGYFNDLFYVPNGPGDVKWVGGAAMEQRFFDWLAKNPELAAYKGQIAPANEFRTKWVNSFDVHISQELPGLFEGHKTELALDIMNVGNLLNKKWGRIEDYGFNSTARVASYAGIDPATGKYIYNFTGTTDEPTVQENNNDKGNTGVSRWSMQLTLKYKF